MRNLKNYCIKTFFSKDLSLRVRLFHVLAITGFLICVAMTVISIAGNMMISTFVNIGTGLVSLFLLFYSAKTGKYKFCYLASVVVIFLFLFPVLFFSSGGYKGGMPFFFVFAVVFTVYMLDGWLMVSVATGEILFYTYLCVISYLYPQWVVPFSSPKAEMIDVIVGLCTVSISLGVTMFVQIRMYRKQEKMLEKAQWEAESASEAKSAFLANMSHEIRTPIHIILGMNEIIYRESRGRQIQEYSAKVDEASKMLLSLVDSILDVSKIESGKTDIIPVSYETGNLVRTLVLIGKSQCSSRGLRFSCHVSEALPPHLIGDYAHIQQIVTNFLSNAAKYTSSGSVTLNFSQEPGPEPEQIYLCISVQDTGMGIRKEALPDLFDAFSRADASSHQQIAGTGLGLAIAKKLTELMGGTVQVESTLGVGSTFSVKILQQTDSGEKEVQEDQIITFAAPAARLLVVDDNQQNRMLMQQLLKPLRMKIDTAGSGQEALELVRANAYHLIFLDYMMPGMDGLAVMNALKEIPDFHTPVIGLTADATAETAKKMESAGCTVCIAKPVPWKTLQDVLLQYLPDSLITIMEEDTLISENRCQLQKLESQLLSYGIILEEGLSYFRNNLEEYCEAARIFLNHDCQEQAAVQSFFDADDLENLRFHMHSLKGKARNMGMTRLAEVSAYGESLCTSGNREEMHSLMPYLLYMWKKGMEGLQLLVPTEHTADNEDTPDYPQCLQELPELLQQFKRKPSLLRIQVLKAHENDPEGQSQLEEISRLVNAILFEEAEAALKRYLNWKEDRS